MVLFIISSSRSQNYLSPPTKPDTANDTHSAHQSITNQSVNINSFTMGCCGGASDVQSTISKPYVVRSAASPIPAGDENLPVGIQLTGGPRLRSMDLRGQGVKVAVIDSGVDKDHPGFHGKVVHQTWYRKGTPLSEDDHGTHVAVSIVAGTYSNQENCICCCCLTALTLELFCTGDDSPHGAGSQIV